MTFGNFTQYLCLDVEIHKNIGFLFKGFKAQKASKSRNDPIPCTIPSSTPIYIHSMSVARRLSHSRLNFSHSPPMHIVKHAQGMSNNDQTRAHLLYMYIYNFLLNVLIFN